MAVLKPMLKLALLPLLLLLILAQWVGIFLTTFSIVLTNLLAGLFFFVALASWVMKLADGGEVLKMLITAFVVFVLPYIAIAAIAKISFFAEELRDFLAEAEGEEQVSASVSAQPSWAPPYTKISSDLMISETDG